MLIKKPADIRPSEITSQENYLNRREFIRAGAIAGGTLLAPNALGALIPEGKLAKLPGIIKSPYSTDEEPNSYDDITTSRIRPRLRAAAMDDHGGGRG